MNNEHLNTAPTMTLDELKAMFLDFIRNDLEDACSRCANYEPTRCKLGAWWVNDNGYVEYDDKLFLTEPCIDGIFERYKQRKGDNGND